MHVGVTDVVPKDQNTMEPSEFNLKECEFHEGPVQDGATVRIECPSGEVSGRFLVVQLSGRNYLTLCEVTAAAAIPQIGGWI